MVGVEDIDEEVAVFDADHVLILLVCGCSL